MGVARKVAMEGGGRAGSLGKVLLHGSQAVILFGAETWMIFSPMTQRLEGAHVGSLRQVTGKQAMRRRDESWCQVTIKAVLQGGSTQPLRTYVDRIQATVANRVSIQYIFDVCTRETSYKGRGRLWGPWWRQEAAENQLKVTV